MTPSDRRYAKSHEWILIEGNVATVGITDHAQKALGDITFVEINTLNKPVRAAQSCGVIESVKAASDLYAPTAGTVSAVNPLLTTQPEVVNQDPYGQGWLFKLTAPDTAGMTALLDAAAYDAFVKAQG